MFGIGTLLVIGLAGYRLAPRRKSTEEVSSGSSDQDTRVAELSPVRLLPLGLRGAHVAAFTSLLAMFCTVLPTRILNNHIVVTVTRRICRNVFGEITSISVRSYSTNRTLMSVKGLTKLENLILNDTKITDAGLVHFEGMGLKELMFPK